MTRRELWAPWLAIGGLLIVGLLVTLARGQDGPRIDPAPPVLLLDVPTTRLSACCWTLPYDAQVAVYRNGVRQKANVDYWLAGRTVVFQPAPAADDVMTFDAIPAK